MRIFLFSFNDQFALNLLFLNFNDSDLHFIYKLLTCAVIIKKISE